MALWCLAGCPITWCLPPRLSKWSFPAWCFAGCPISPFLPPWWLPGASQAAHLVLPCLPGASQAVQLILSCLTPFLPPWCLPDASQAVQMVLSCFPGACLRDDAVLSCGLVAPPGLSKWSLSGPWLSSGQAKSNLALADYWNQLVLPWQITGVIRLWEFRAEP